MQACVEVDLLETQIGKGKTVLLAYSGTLNGVQSADGWLGAIAVADELRPNARQIIQSLRDAGIEQRLLIAPPPI